MTIAATSSTSMALSFLKGRFSGPVWKTSTSLSSSVLRTLTLKTPRVGFGGSSITSSTANPFRGWPKIRIEASRSFSFAASEAPRVLNAFHCLQISMNTSPPDAMMSLFCTIELKRCTLGIPRRSFCQASRPGSACKRHASSREPREEHEDARGGTTNGAPAPGTTGVRTTSTTAGKRGENRKKKEQGPAPRGRGKNRKAGQKRKKEKKGKGKFCSGARRSRTTQSRRGRGLRGARSDEVAPLGTAPLPRADQARTLPRARFAVRWRKATPLPNGGSRAVA